MAVSRVFLELCFRVVVKRLLWRSLGCFQSCVSEWLLRGCYGVCVSRVFVFQSGC